MRSIFLWLALALEAALMCGWEAQAAFISADIGSQAPAGQTVATNGGFNVSSATGDVWGTADDFRFVYQQVAGDFDIRARIASFTGIGYWAKAGLMVRDGLADSGVNGFMVATRSAGWGRYMFTGRLSRSFNSYVYSQGSFERVRYSNVWVRLVRVGSEVVPMHSTNGVAWTQVGNLTFNQLPRTVFAGMAVSNHPDSGTSKATAQFRDVALDIGAPVAPAILSQPYSQMVNPGVDVTFGVTAVGRGTLGYQWFRDGERIEGETNAAHTVRAVQESDEAKFTCLVRNESGEALSWAGLLEVEEAHRPFDGILGERYSRTYGRRVEYMINATNYPGAPYVASQLPLFEISSLGDDTGGRLRGYVTAPMTGDYTFYMAADDRGELWLGSDDNPASKRLIAECYYWVNPRQWDYYNAQISNPIRLQAGKRYYMEALVKGEGSPNHGSVGWYLPNGTFQGPIPASHFASRAAVFQAVQWMPALPFGFRIEGTLNSLYILEASTNLTAWSPIFTNRAPFDFSEASLPAGPRQFYRAVTSP